MAEPASLYEPLRAAERPVSRGAAAARGLLLAGTFCGGAACALVASRWATSQPSGALEPLALAAARGPHTGRWCHESKTYSKSTLKTVRDAHVHALLPYADLHGATKFEASDILHADGHYYVICDSSWDILRVHESLPMLSPQNTQIRAPPELAALGDSGFEAIFRDQTGNGVFLVRESVDLSDQIGRSGDEGVYREPAGLPEPRRLGLPARSTNPAFHALVMRVALPDPSAPSGNYTVLDECPSEIRFEGSSKGFEGAISILGADGVLYVLGLCEGNHCQEGNRGTDAGNGRVVVMARNATGGPMGGCVWSTVRILELPKEVGFVDYSAISLHHPTQTVAITSQENSQVWIGKLEGGSNGAFDPATARFHGGQILDFPRNSNCEMQYCNIEGIHWQWGGAPGTPQLLVAASDKMKNGGRQGFSCFDKDQSLHVFAIP